jgi:hypothetical protein
MSFLAAAALSLAMPLLSPPAANAAVATFTPGSAQNDTYGNALQMHGLGIVKSGSTWYAFGENKVGGNSTDGSPFQSIPCYSSTDLSQWTFQGNALSLQASGDLGPNRVVERPKVIYNASTSTYVMYLHIDSSNYGVARVGVATSATPCGPYTYLGSSRPMGNLSRDIGLFQDTDGSGYLMSEDRNAGLRIYSLSSDYLTVTSAVKVLPSFESPAMVKVDGRYYLLGSSLTGWSLNDNSYATTTSLSGTWSAFRKFAPVGTKTYNTQTANIIPVQGTSGTTYIYAGDRWNGTDLGASPLVWLPLTISGETVSVGWQNSWSLDVTAGTWTGTTNPADGVRRLTNANSSMRLDVANGSTANGAKIIQWTATTGTNQQWKLNRVRYNIYTLTGVGSAKCLEVPSQSTVQGAQLGIWTCNGGANQQWALAATGSWTSASAPFVLTNAKSGWVIDVSGASTTAGAIVDQWVDNGGSHQKWTLS